VEELIAYIFGIYIKFGYKNPSISTPSDSVDVATSGMLEGGGQIFRLCNMPDHRLSD
jgi:hypothetical protein